MASPVPAKSQPLHNFSLPHLKWSKNQASSQHQRGRRPAGGGDSSPPVDAAARRQSPLLDMPRRHSPMRDSASESDAGYASENRRKSVHESGVTGIVFPTADHKNEKSEKKLAVSEVDGAGGKEGRSKLYIRLPAKNKPNGVQDEAKAVAEEGELEESVAKTWNLRPRKPISKQSNLNGGPSKVGKLFSQENKPQSQQAIHNRMELIRSRGGSEAEAASKKDKKRKFSVSLSRQEIEEDIFAITGSKPARKPKKRARAVQKQLDNLFPGLWLTSITPDLYKVSENPTKG
ncbi:uncharacterized protein LOC127813979 [Diospyros lotus]|uniref:uncharacterized protein LOC127813979 n=1 Tax=Diospyros lotus TaxID=55363 RepID=UPI0022541865|nr:uncharacterized protein LOC127813979 [Diospyros lotus]